CVCGRSLAGGRCPRSCARRDCGPTRPADGVRPSCPRSASVRAVALPPLARQFYSLLWCEPEPVGTTGSKCNPAHVPDHSLLNTYVLERCNGILGIHGPIP